MASIKKRQYWADPATGKEVRKGTPGAVRRESAHYRIRYTDAAGAVVSVKGYKDKKASEQLAGRLELAAARGEEGLVNAFKKHDQRPLSAHVADFLADLLALGRDDHYRYVMGRRLTRLAGECSWRRLRDITAESFIAWRRARALAGGTGNSGKTLNQWFDSINAFLNWCAAKEQNRIARNTVAGIAKLPESPTFRRKALDASMLQAAYAGGARDGAERWKVYAFIVTTGLRRTETEDLLWGDAVLDAPVPFLKLRDEATKARRGDVFALKAEIAAMLLAIRPAAWSEDMPVFPEGVPTVGQFLDDLRAGGAGDDLPAADAIERVDIHALRTTLGSFLNRSGMPERTAMGLLRVTDAKLLRHTYCDPKILETAQAVARLDVALPVQLRTTPDVRDCPPPPSEPAPVFTVSEGNILSIQADVRDCPPPPATSKNSAGRIRTYQFPPQNPGNLQIQGSAGPTSDKRPAVRLPDALLTQLTDLWPELPPAVRASIVTMAKAATPAASQRKAGGA